MSVSRLQSSEHLLTKVLTWTAQAIMGADMAATPNPQMLLLFGEPILDLLDDKLPVSLHVRSNVLHLIRLLVKSLRDGGTLAGAVRFFLMLNRNMHNHHSLIAARFGYLLHFLRDGQVTKSMTCTG